MPADEDLRDFALPIYLQELVKPSVFDHAGKEISFYDKTFDHAFYDKLPGRYNKRRDVACRERIEAMTLKTRQTVIFTALAIVAWRPLPITFLESLATRATIIESLRDTLPQNGRAGARPYHSGKDQ
jgi:hypothetical protein